MFKSVLYDVTYSKTHGHSQLELKISTFSNSNSDNLDQEPMDQYRLSMLIQSYEMKSSFLSF